MTTATEWFKILLTFFQTMLISNDSICCMPIMPCVFSQTYAIWSDDFQALFYTFCTRPQYLKHVVIYCNICVFVYMFRKDPLENVLLKVVCAYGIYLFMNMYV